MSGGGGGEESYLDQNFLQLIRRHVADAGRGAVRKPEAGNLICSCALAQILHQVLYRIKELWYVQGRF